MTAITRTAYPRLSSGIVGRELLEEFTPTDDELAWAVSRTKDERHRLALVLHRCAKSSHSNCILMGNPERTSKR